MVDNLKDKAEGAFDKVKGKAEEAVGKKTGDPQLEDQGQYDQTKGEVKKGVADVKDTVDDALDNVRKNTR